MFLHVQCYTIFCALRLVFVPIKTQKKPTRMYAAAKYLKSLLVCIMLTLFVMVINCLLGSNKLNE